MSPIFFKICTKIPQDVQSYHQIVKEFYAAESLQLAELESVLIFNISQSVLKILAKQFLFFNNAFTV